MRASPAAARGTRKIENRQATVVTSVSLGASMGIIFFPLAESDAIGKRGPIQVTPRQHPREQTQLAKLAKRKAQSRPAPATIPPAASGNPQPSFPNPPVLGRDACPYRNAAG